MKYIYKVQYEQKFGREWFGYTDTVAGNEDGFSVVNKAERKALSQVLEDEDGNEIECSGFRLIGLERQGSFDY